MSGRTFTAEDFVRLVAKGEVTVTKTASGFQIAVAENIPATVWEDEFQLPEQFPEELREQADQMQARATVMNALATKMRAFASALEAKRT